MVKETEEIIPTEVTPLSDLAIERGALIPSNYKRGAGAERNSTSVCVEVDDELNVFVDADGAVKKENARAKKAFEDYVNIGPTRSLEKLTNLYIQPQFDDWTDNYESVLRQLKRYSSNFDWQNRLRMLLTREAASAISAARHEQANSMRGRIATAKKIQKVGNELLEKASKFLEANIDTMSDKDANTLLKTAVTMLDMGLAAERIEIGGAMDNLVPPKPVSAMDDEELNEFIKVLSTQIA